MTLPDERRRAIDLARGFLMSLLDTKLTPRVPRTVRRRALACLRHYPQAVDMVDVQEAFGPKPDNDGVLR